MILNALKTFSAKLRALFNGRATREKAPALTAVEGMVSNGLLQPPTREDIRQSYRLILGREPESARVIDEQMQFPNVGEFRIAVLKSIEFRSKYLAICADKPDPYYSMERRALVFIHLEKTGGTTLQKLLAANYDEERICPGPNNPIFTFSVAELGHYDFFAGHFDVDSLKYIPRQHKLTVSLFREPCSRLISWYRFHRAHPSHGDHAANRLVVLAHAHTAEEFFELPEVRSNSLAYNRYLLAFGRSFTWFDQKRNSLTKDDLESALRDAKRAIAGLTALGITEQFARSLTYICKTLSMSRPEIVKSANVTDEMPNKLAGFRQVESVRMTPRLAAALQELTAYDQEIYKFAIMEFERRCGAMDVSEERAPAANLLYE